MTHEHHPPHPDDGSGGDATERTNLHSFQPGDVGRATARQMGAAEPAPNLTHMNDEDAEDAARTELALEAVTLTDAWNENEPLRIWVPDSSDRMGVARALVSAARNIEAHGPAYLAYLALPDVDATNPDLERAFHEHYVGSFVSTDQLIDDLTEVKDWKKAIASLADRLGITDFIHIDRTRLLARVYEIWDIVPGDGQLHVFDK